MFRPLAIALAALAVLGGCSQQDSGAAVAAAGSPSTAAPAAPQAPAAPVAPAVAAPQAAAPQATAQAPAPSNEIFTTAPAQPAAAVNVGKVLQLQNGGGYT